MRSAGETAQREELLRGGMSLRPPLRYVMHGGDGHAMIKHCSNIRLNGNSEGRRAVGRGGRGRGDLGWRFLARRLRREECALRFGAGSADLPEAHPILTRRLCGP